MTLRAKQVTHQRDAALGRLRLFFLILVIIGVERPLLATPETNWLSEIYLITMPANYNTLH